MNASQYIDRLIARQSDWRGPTMAEIRRIIRETVPDVTEELKWMGTPTWSHNGVVCICKPFNGMVKVTFLNGAQLRDPEGVFNAELDGAKWRAIKFFEGNPVNESGLKRILCDAVSLNAARAAARKERPAETAGHAPARRRTKVKRSGSRARRP